MGKIEILDRCLSPSKVRFWLYNKTASKNQYELLDESILDCFFDAKNDLDYNKPCKGTQTKCEEICEETDEAAEQYCYENCETVDVTLAEALLEITKIMFMFVKIYKYLFPEFS